jgi:hypothetical protein
VPLPSGALIENQGAHHFANPYLNLDVATEQQLFAQVERLKRFFKCGEAGCSGTLKFSETHHGAICSKDSCGHVFQLQPEPW